MRADKQKLAAEIAESLRQSGLLLSDYGTTTAARDLIARYLPDEADTPRWKDAAEALWNVVANASGGDWDMETAEWVIAASRARDMYHAALAADRPVATTHNAVLRAAAAIANARGGRRGAPPLTNVLDILPPKLLAEVTEDARAALRAAEPVADELKAPRPIHNRVWKYDGAFLCLDCKAQWGALPGKPTMPQQCHAAQQPASDELNETQPIPSLVKDFIEREGNYQADEQGIYGKLGRALVGWRNAERAAQPADETPLRKVATMERDWDVLLSEICAAQLLMRNGDAADALAELAKAEAHARELLAAQPIEQEKDK